MVCRRPGARFARLPACGGRSSLAPAQRAVGKPSFTTLFISRISRRSANEPRIARSHLFYVILRTISRTRSRGELAATSISLLVRHIRWCSARTAWNQRAELQRKFLPGDALTVCGFVTTLLMEGFSRSCGSVISGTKTCFLFLCSRSK